MSICHVKMLRKACLNTSQIRGRIFFASFSFLHYYSCNSGRKIGSQRTTEQGSQAQVRQVRPSFRCDSANATDLHTHAAEIGKPAYRNAYNQQPFLGYDGYRS